MLDINQKISLLKTYTKEQIWYIVKQEMQFWKVCYAVSILKQYQVLKEKENTTESLETFFKKRCSEIKAAKSFNKFEGTHRMLLQGYMLGLIRKEGRSYNTAKITDVYETIYKKCNGNFEKIHLYYDIIENQIEKIYLSSELDEESNGKRQNYKLYPLFLLYKVLLEIGQTTGEFKISKEEFNVFVCTTETYKDYLITVFYILAKRNNQLLQEEVKNLNLKLKEDIRFHKILKNIKTIEESTDSFKLNDEFIDYVKQKVYLYETSEIVKISNKDYFDLLCSSKSLLKVQQSSNINILKGDNYMEFDNIEKNEIDKSIPKNLIVYGAPGTGKSSKLENEYRKKYFDNEYLYNRVTFNPNYGYTDFIGVYKPTPIYVESQNDNKYYAANKQDLLEHQMMPVIDYSFVAGPFIETLCKAINDTNHNYLLLIEEINRADVASVFGDVFQLLDRSKDGEHEGSSEYGIVFNQDIMNYIASKVINQSHCFVKNKLVKIPENMYIWATMNSADQNVVKMDTAFKRRWAFDYIGINDKESGVNDVFVKFTFLQNEIKWNDFRHCLNDFLSSELEVEEDKLIGPYFINNFEVNEMDSTTKRYILQDDIKFKLFLYLKDDILRHSVTELFKENYTFGKLIDAYDACKDVFIADFTKQLKTNNIEA